MSRAEVPRRCPRRERGQTLVEFSAAMLILGLIVLGIVDMSRAVYARNMVASAAREGARYGSTQPDDIAKIQAAAKATVVGLDGIQDAARWNVFVDFPVEGEENLIQVRVEYVFHPVSGYIARFVQEGTAGLTLRGCAKMRLERRRTVP